MLGPSLISSSGQTDDHQSDHPVQGSQHTSVHEDESDEEEEIEHRGVTPPSDSVFVWKGIRYTVEQPSAPVQVSTNPKWVFEISNLRTRSKRVRYKSFKEFDDRSVAWENLAKSHYNMVFDHFVQPAGFQFDKILVAA